MEILISLSFQQIEPPIVEYDAQKAPHVNDNSKPGQVFDLHTLQNMSYLDMKRVRGDGGKKYAKVIAQWLNGQRNIEVKFRVGNRSKISIEVKNTKQLAARYTEVYLLSPEKTKSRGWMLIGTGPHGNENAIDMGGRLQPDVLYATARSLLGSHLPTDEWPGDNTREQVIFKFDKMRKEHRKVPDRAYKFVNNNETQLITMMQDGMSIDEIVSWVLNQY